MMSLVSPSDLSADVPEGRRDSVLDKEPSQLSVSATTTVTVTNTDTDANTFKMATSCDDECIKSELRERKEERRRESKRKQEAEEATWSRTGKSGCIHDHDV